MKKLLTKIKKIIYYPIYNKYNEILNFIKNIIYFRKFLWVYRDWDYSYVLLGLKYSLIPLKKRLSEKGYEIPESKDKKINKIERVIEILNNIEEDKYIDIAENLVGKLTYSDDIFNNDGLTQDELNINNRVYRVSNDIQEMEWIELFHILKGKKMYNGVKDYDKWFDGSGLRGWWD